MKILLCAMISLTTGLLFSMEATKADMHCPEDLHSFDKMETDVHDESNGLNDDPEICLKTFDSNGSYPVRESVISTIPYLVSLRSQLAAHKHEVAVPYVTMESLKLCLTACEFYSGLKKIYPKIDADDQLCLVNLCPLVAHASSYQNLLFLLADAQRLGLKYLKNSIFYFICMRGLASLYVELLSKDEHDIQYDKESRIDLARMNLLCNRVSLVDDEMGNLSFNELKAWNILPRNSDEFNDVLGQDNSAVNGVIHTQSSNSQIRLDILKKALKQSYYKPNERLINAWFVANDQIMIGFAQLCAETLVRSRSRDGLLKKCDPRLLDLIKKQFYLMKRKWLNPRYEVAGTMFNGPPEYVACQEVQDPDVLFQAPLDVHELIDRDWKVNALGGQLFLNYNHLSDCSGLTEIDKRHVTFLTLSNNRLSELRAEDFLGFDLGSLNASYNMISRIDPEIFMHMKNLKTLLLSHNIIEKLPEEMFHYLNNLEKLDLSNNKLGSLPTSQEHLKKIQSINLESNCLSAQAIREIKSAFNEKVKITF